VSEAAAGNYLKPARAVFAYAVGEEYIEISPFTKVPRGRLSSCNTKREHREWTTADVERLIRVAYERDEREVLARETDASGRTPQQEYGLAIELKLRLGLRLGELLGVRHSDFVTEERGGVKSHVLLIKRQWTKDGGVDSPKTDYSVRRIPLLPAEYAKVAARKLRIGMGTRISSSRGSAAGTLRFTRTSDGGAGTRPSGMRASRTGRR
jgi:integrase